jgi:F-type H+-transporting ATPase subunit gamma
MANLRDLRRRRKSVANTKKITKTMELVASAKMRKAQAAAAASRPYFEALHEMVGDLVASRTDTVQHPLLVKRVIKVVTIFVCTSDRGLAGAFNSNLVNLAMARAEEHRALGREVRFIALSKKAASTLAFNGTPAVQVISGIMDSPKYERARLIAEEAMKTFIRGETDHVEVVYSRFISASRQNPDHVVMMPVGSDYKPRKGGGAQAAQFLYHPNPNDLLAALVPQLVKTMLFSALLQTSSGEHAARRIAMKNATDAAGDMAKSLATAYNRGRQGKITQEIAEIVGAVEAMA